MSGRQDHVILFEKEDGGFEFCPMASWLGASHRPAPAAPNNGADMLDDLRRALRNVGWELRLVLGRILLFKPDGRTAGGRDDAVIESISVNAGCPDPRKTPEAVRTEVGVERYVRTELRPRIFRPGPGLNTVSRGGEAAGEDRAGGMRSFDVSAEDSGGPIAVIEFKVGIATSREIACVLSYMDAIAAATGKPVLGVLIAGGFHKRIVLATRAMPAPQLRRRSFQFSFAAVN